MIQTNRQTIQTATSMGRKQSGRVRKREGIIRDLFLACERAVRSSTEQEHSSGEQRGKETNKPFGLLSITDLKARTTLRSDTIAER